MNRIVAGVPLLALPLLAAAVFATGCTGVASDGGSSAPRPTAIAVSVASSSMTVQAGQPQTLTATVANDSAGKGVTWIVSGTGCVGAACGSISPTSSASGATVTYTAPATVPTPPTVTVTATSVADGTKSASTTFTLSASGAAISVSLSATSANIGVSGTHNFTATVQNDRTNKGVAWLLSGAGCSGPACGTLSATNSASGAPITYTAPASVPTPATVTLAATSVADSTKSSSATITISATSTGNISLSLTPKRGGLTLGQTMNFMATLNNDSQSKGVTWSASAGSFTAQTTTTATFKAPTNAGAVTITATSIADVTARASATIGVTDLAGVYTYHNDNSRDGANTKEYALSGPNGSTPSNVSSSTFGKLFSCAVDGAVYAQPLWVANVAINGGTHNVIVVATAHDSLYAFDADASPCMTYWHANLLDAAHGGTAGETPVPTDENSSFVGNHAGDISPETGVIGTPVIDPNTDILYVVSKSIIQSSSTFFQRLHAIKLATGTEAFTNPAIISGATVTYPGTGDGGSTTSFNPGVELQRAGLALVNGVVYICWASHEDAGHYYGWVAGYKASDLSLVSTFNAAPSSNGFAGIWMSGGAPAADSDNNLYIITGNGNFDGNTNFGNSFLKLSTSNGLARVDSFTPSEQDDLNTNDRDVGAGGAALLVNVSSQKQLVIGGGKGATFAGQLYVLDSGALGGYRQGAGSTDNVLQEFSFNHAIFATAAFFQNTLYIAGVNGPTMAFALNPSTGTLNTTPTSSSSVTFGFPGATPSVSSNGTSNGIIWVLDNSSYCTTQSRSCGPAVLHAYDPTNLRTELWNSGGSAGNAVKFTVPTVANGKVYVGTRGNSTSNGGVGELDVYGLLAN